MVIVKKAAAAFETLTLCVVQSITYAKIKHYQQEPLAPSKDNILELQNCNMSKPSILELNVSFWLISLLLKDFIVEG